MENRHRRLGKQAYQRSNSNLWVVALHAFFSDSYAEMGRELNRSRETVRRWAAAYTAYRQVRHIDVTRARAIRKALSVTHFSKLYELWIRYEFSPVQALEYMQLAVDNNWSPETLAVEVKGCEEGHELFGDWKKFTATLRGWAADLLNGFVPHDLPDEYKHRARKLAEQTDELAREVDELRGRLR